MVNWLELLSSSVRPVRLIWAFSASLLYEIVEAGVIASEFSLNVTLRSSVLFLSNSGTDLSAFRLSLRVERNFTGTVSPEIRKKWHQTKDMNNCYHKTEGSLYDNATKFWQWVYHPLSWCDHSAALFYTMTFAPTMFLVWSKSKHTHSICSLLFI